MKLKNFQLQDLARLSLHDGGILGWDTGAGKGLALFVLPALKCGFQKPATGSAERPGLRPLKPVLLVAPGDLHQQIIDEGALHFRATITLLDSQETFLRLASVNPAGGYTLPPGYYLTSYTQLTSNGITEFPKYDPANWLGLMQQLGLDESHGIAFWEARGEHYARQYKRLGVGPDISAAMLRRRVVQLQADASDAHVRELQMDYEVLAQLAPPDHRCEFNALTNSQQEFVLRESVAHAWRQYSGSIGSAQWCKHKSGVKRVSGRHGEPQEFVEFQEAHQRIVAQAMPGGGWNVFKCVGESVEVLQSFPEKRQAVPFAEAQAAGTVQPFKVKCVYSPSLADLCQDTFECVCVDEGVRMKGEETEIGLGLRQMNPKYRYVLSATPIKNRLPDAFRLAWWASGALPEAHARWPYPDSSAAREQFATEFLISERNLSKELKSEAKRRFVKLTPQVCNLHRLWKLFAPVILRRRKRDFGEDIVAKTRHVVRVPMGVEQAAVYKFHLEANYVDKNGLPAIGAQLQALRMAAANPCSGLLDRPGFDTKTQGEPRSRSSHIPKLHAALKLIATILARGEQVVVFSAFHDSLDALSARLEESGVKHCVLDGRTSQKKRAAIASDFKLGPPKANTTSVQASRTGLRIEHRCSTYPVMLAGVECMAEGHSFPLCNNVILLAYSWAYDKFEQAINRVHRLNSRWDVNVYPIICEGSIDRKLEALIQEKGDAAELVLDGKLMAEHSAEVNLAELLHTARAEFAGKVVVDEKELAHAWVDLRQQVSAAATLWRQTWAQGAPKPAAASVEVKGDEVKAATTFATSSITVAMEPAKPRPALPRPAARPAAIKPAGNGSFTGMALWQQSGNLPKRPMPFARK